MASRGRLLRIPFVFAFLVVAAALFPQEREGTGAAASAYLLLSKEIQEAELLLAGRVLGDGEALSAADVGKLKDLAQEARVSLYGDLIDRSVLLLMLAEEQLTEESLKQSRTARVAAIMGSRELDRRRSAARARRSIALWGSLGTSAASFAVAFTFWYLSELQDESYFLATTIDDAVKYRTYFKLFSWISYLSAGVGVLSAGVSIPVLAAQH